MTARSFFRRTLLAIASTSLLLLASVAHASTGACDDLMLSPTGPDRCIAAIQASGNVVVNDIFHDTAGNDALNLPVYGVLFNQWPGCDFTSFAGCAGYDTGTYDCPGDYACDATITNTFQHASDHVNGKPDHLWWHPCRSSTHTLDANNCPQTTCVADSDASGYFPWEGLVFDLGGPSNKVAIFATNDHGPQPCESLEYTVYLSDNPFAKEQVDHPVTDGVDPTKWNRAVLSKIFTKGWYNTRDPDVAGHGSMGTVAACGDTADYAVEQDSFVQEFSLPCGITFKYAAVIAGNDGLDFPACQFASSEAELDAVAGLTESGAGVCPDADGDHFVDCNCPTAPPICDCDDHDATVHPGAPESCDSTKDLNCDKKFGTDCPANTFCENGLCLGACGGGEFQTCPAGYECKGEPDGKRACAPIDCGCQPGQVCVNNVCQDACMGVVCPGGQICQDGQCLDPCMNVACPPPNTCENGVCHPPCNCYAGNLGCPDMTLVCDANNTNQCVTPICQNVMCGPNQTCDPTSGTCVDFCNSGVMCPVGQTCDDARGCVSKCDGVTCSDPSEVCDPMSGKCEDPMCVGVVCTPPEVCKMGQCSGGSSVGTSFVTTGTSTATGTGGHTSSSGSGSGGAPFGSGGNGDGATQASGGCCGVAGGSAPEGRGAAALALLGLGLVVANRRRRRS